MKKYEISMNSDYNDSLDNIINEGEQILWQGKPHKAAYISEPFFRMMPFALLWLAIDIAIIVCIFKFFMPNVNLGQGNIIYYAILIPFFILHLLPVWIWIFGTVKNSLEHKNIEYAVTDRRIVIRHGVIGIDFLSLFYTDIESVNVKVGLLDRLFKVGDMQIVAKSTKAMISDIKDPYSVYKLIQKVSLDMRTDAEYPNQYRPEKNEGYNTAYTVDLPVENQGKESTEN